MSASLDGVYAETESFQETLEHESFQQEPYDPNYPDATSQQAYDQGHPAQEVFEQTYQETAGETVAQAATDGGPTLQERFLDKFGLQEWLTVESFQSWNYLTISLAAVLALVLGRTAVKTFCSRDVSVVA